MLCSCAAVQALLCLLLLQQPAPGPRTLRVRGMKLKRFLLRYYPPGIILEYTDHTGEELTKPIDLLHLTPDTDVDVRLPPAPCHNGLRHAAVHDATPSAPCRPTPCPPARPLSPCCTTQVLLDEIIRAEALLSEKRKPQLSKLVNKLIDKLEENAEQSFYLFKILRAHILPLTNCAFNKSGDRFITGSYDRTCKVWNTNTGEELLTLEGARRRQRKDSDREIDASESESARQGRAG
jgi:dynein assembly factor with WDR repeat domains 1